MPHAISLLSATEYTTFCGTVRVRKAKNGWKAEHKPKGAAKWSKVDHQNTCFTAECALMDAVELLKLNDLEDLYED